MRDILKEAQRLFRLKTTDIDESDPILEEAVKLIVQHDKASASLLQRRLSIGYARAARLLDLLESRGVLGPAQGAMPRNVLVSSYEDYLQGKFTEPTPVSSTETEENRTYKLPSFIKIVKDKTLRRISSLKDATSLIFPVGWKKDDLIIKSFQSNPHCIITGNPTSQKLTYLDTLLSSLLIRHTPTEVRFIFLDGAHYLHPYNGIPHLLTPVTSEPDKALSALRWGINEIELRFKHFQRSNVRDIERFNTTQKDQMPHIVYVLTQIDDFMSYASKEMTDSLRYISSVGHRAGIHLVLLTDLLTQKSIPSEIQENILIVIQFKSSLKMNNRPQAAVLLPPSELLYKTDAMESWDQLSVPIITEEEMQKVLQSWK